jgi:DNA/RNA-binding domain of Phe-tRNA-synthetase-like protein
MTDSDELAERGRIDADLEEEMPGLYLRHVRVDRGSGKSPAGLKERLAILSSRFAGPQAIALRNKPIPWAYRVFYRHIGLDPDVQRTPVEAIALERMMRGGFISQNLLDDALTIATIESGVPIRAFDADRVGTPLTIRPSGEGEALEGRPGELPTGTLILADPERPIGLLFGAIASGRGVSPTTQRTLLTAIGVRGVPEIAVEEALWLVADAMRSA